MTWKTSARRHSNVQERRQNENKGIVCATCYDDAVPDCNLPSDDQVLVLIKAAIILSY